MSVSISSRRFSIHLLITSRSGAGGCAEPFSAYYGANTTQPITSSWTDPGVRNVTQHGYTNHLQLLGGGGGGGEKKKRVIGLVHCRPQPLVWARTELSEPRGPVKCQRGCVSCVPPRAPLTAPPDSAGEHQSAAACIDIFTFVTISDWRGGRKKKKDATLLG